jgi:hypothetical protein
MVDTLADHQSYQKHMIYYRWIVILFVLMVSKADNQPVKYSRKTMSETKRWIITLSTNRPLGEVSDEVTKAGFAVEQVLDQIGCITGSGSDDVARRLRKMPGIADVSPDVEIQIPPPDEPITW